MQVPSPFVGRFCRVGMCILIVARCSAVFAGTGGYADWQDTTNYITTGGSGGTTTTVTTVSAFTTAVGSASPMVVLFSNPLNVGAFSGIKNNKTIIGLGTNATLLGDLQLFKVTNVVVQNVFFTNPSEVGDADGITMQCGQHIWIDHCTFYDTGDGALDLTHACDFDTVSYSKFYYTTNTGHDFVNLVGHSDNNAAEDTGKLHITFHHNWWSTLCVERMPRVRFGRIHSYNNYFNAPGNNYCIRASITSEVLVVKNVFENVDTPYEYFASSSGTGSQIGKIFASSNAFINCTGTGTFSDTVFTPPYAFTMDETNLVAGIVTNNAGAGRLPVAAFTANMTNGAAPLTVTFTNVSYGLITGGLWNFGDSSTTNTTNSIVSHVYNTGTYTVVLTASGPAGSGVCTQSNYIVVTGGTPPPVANFTASSTNGTAQLAVTFTDTSTGSITNRFWDFGDGNTTNFVVATNPLHTYGSGVYSVTLTASGPGGNSTLVSNNLITVVTTFQAWQQQYFSCTNCPQADAAADPDGDGQNNQAEFLSGTDPTNNLSGLRIVSTATENDDVRITWTTAGGSTNVVQATTGDLDGGYATNFADISGPIVIPGSGDTLTNYVDIGGATNLPSRFYRIRLQP